MEKLYVMSMQLNHGKREALQIIRIYLILLGQQPKMFVFLMKKKTK